MHNAQPQYDRFNLFQRIEHGVLLVSFTVLAITGLPQMFSLQPWAVFMIAALGGIETVRIIHRAAAVLLIVGTIYHFVAVSYRIFVRRVAMTMLPGWQDVRDGLQALGYNVGLVKTPPRMGRYNFGEKIEYWAVIWGTVVMVLTGFMLWNPIATTTFLPGQFIPAAKAAHGGEALLAVLSIITWHFYNVHVKRFNRSMFTGKISHEEMEEEHALELEALTRRERSEPDPEGVQRRQRLFTPVAAVITTALLIGLYFFVTYEQTAITTVPRQQVDVFTPLTPESGRVQ
ncbi:MAG TPA: cytochrome C [Chloroflexi bacterium]|nr:cytochrome C [Chloroflexota bacterium]HHW86684.1 cytochrome C [Chloroflexota bacterium]